MYNHCPVLIAAVMDKMICQDRAESLGACRVIVDKKGTRSFDKTLKIHCKTYISLIDVLCSETGSSWCPPGGESSRRTEEIVGWSPAVRGFSSSESKCELKQLYFVKFHVQCV